MAHKQFTVQIVTVANALFDGAASELQCKGVGGEITILADHEPLITRIEPCNIRVRTQDGEEQSFAIGGGVLEVADNKAVVLCSSDERDLPA